MSLSRRSSILASASTCSQNACFTSRTSSRTLETRSYISRVVMYAPLCPSAMALLRTACLHWNVPRRRQVPRGLVRLAEDVEGVGLRLQRTRAFLRLRERVLDARAAFGVLEADDDADLFGALAAEDEFAFTDDVDAGLDPHAVGRGATEVARAVRGVDGCAAEVLLDEHVVLPSRDRGPGRAAHVSA